MCGKPGETELNAFTAGNPLLGTNLLGISIGRGLLALKGLTVPTVYKLLGTSMIQSLQSCTSAMVLLIGSLF